MNNRAIHIMNVLQSVQDILDAMNDHNANIQGYLSPVANEVIMTAIVQPFYNNLLNIFLNNNINYSEKCIQVERLGFVIVSYVIEFNVEPLANYLL